MNNDILKDFRKFSISNTNVRATVFDDYAKYIDSYVNPYIAIPKEEHTVTMDIFSRLMVDRIIFLGTSVTPESANIITSQLLYLDNSDKGDIQIYINSPGGEVYSGLQIYDTMQIINADVSTICSGMAASMASVLLCAGTTGKRFALPHSRVMIHQPMQTGGGRCQASDMEISVKEINALKKDLYEIISKHSGQSIKKITKDADRDYWMDSKLALKYGMIDKILETKK